MRPRTRVVEKSAVPVSKKNVTLARAKKTRPEPKESLKKRRRKSQKVLLIVAGVTLAILVIAFFCLAWQPMFRVSAVSASGPHAEEAKALALAELSGTHAFILPRNSLFFLPDESIRSRILSAYPDVEAVSIGSDGLNALRLSTLPRAEAFLWCGVTHETADGTCYSANAEGLVFAPVSPGIASTTGALRVYGPIEGESPVGSSITESAHIPEALRFVKAMQTLGADIVSLSFRGDEADLHTEAGTRITYVLGHEQEAAGIAASVFPQLTLNDGSIAYVDLRFSGKAYFKRAGGVEPVAE